MKILDVIAAGVGLVVLVPIVAALLVLAIWQIICIRNGKKAD